LTLSSSNLNFFFVAYLDILGFSNMVKSDCESPNNSEKYMDNLFEIYEHTRNLHDNSSELDIIQFSDSIVLTMPFSKDQFSIFIKIISKFQYNLFCNGIICRGGIAYGKHFAKEGFLFSAGLINAYNIESEIARYPRIVVSNDLIDLIFKNGVFVEDIPLLKEYDDAFFVDFLENTDLNEAADKLNLILEKNEPTNTSIKEKQRWLSEYFDFKASQSDSTITKVGKNRFSN
jgi:hypothetical protein